MINEKTKACENSSALIGYAAAYAATARQFPLKQARAEFESLFQQAEVRKLFSSNMRLLMGVRRRNFVELKQLTGLDHAWLSRICADKVNKISFEAALAISQALNVSLGTMLMKDLQSLCETTIANAESMRVDKSVIDMSDGLSIRSRKALHRLNINYLSELSQRSEEDVLQTRNAGQTTINEFNALLKQHGWPLLKKTDRRGS